MAKGGGSGLKPLLYFGAAYLAVVAAATFWSASQPGTTPTADTIANLPSPGSLVSLGQGATMQSGLLDAGGAVLLWYFAAK